jgi:hypothetical protein
MLLIGLGIGLMVAGIIALATGRMKFSKNRAVQGVPARLLGVALLAPLPAGFLAAMIYTMAHIDPNKPDQAQEWGRQHDGAITAVMAGTMIGLAVLIIVIAAFLAKPIKPQRKRKRRNDYDDVEDDRPRRRRDQTADDEDDRPRRRRPAADVDDDEDRPRRKRDDLDDRAR